jgi:hypothetical protein
MSLERWASRFERWAIALRQAQARPISNPESIPTTTTPATPTTGTSEVVEVVSLMMDRFETMQGETRRLVMEILQGRETSGAVSSSDSLTLERLESEPFQPLDYDREATDDLPASLQAVLAREDTETTQMRQLQTEQALLGEQLKEARLRAGLDEAGPYSEPFFSRESNGPPPPPSAPAGR